MIELFIAVCVVTLNRCTPEQSAPMVFQDFDTCSRYVEMEHNLAKDAVLGDLQLTFRCAEQT